MKTHFAEDNDDVVSANDTAAEHCWREHQVKGSHIWGEVVLALAMIGVMIFSSHSIGPDKSADATAAIGNNAVSLSAAQQHANRLLIPYVRHADMYDDR